VRNAVEPTVYRPFAQSAGDVLNAMPTVCLSVRAAPGASAEALRGAIAPALAGIDPGVSVATVTVSAQLDAYYVRERLLGLLAGFFAVLGLVLAAIGLYGVTAQSVSRRTREFGVRMALGADGRRIARLIARRLGIVVVCGSLLGAAASAAAGRVIESLLFGVTARDPLAFALAMVTLLVTCTAAAWLPARRAARTDPMGVLRES
jgi:predicted lysophospholipase L1 biosynthesis ABC-type transport system permease subunit